MKIIVIGNYTKALILFRGPLIKRFIDIGHTVIAYAPEDDPETADALRTIGAEFRQLRFDRTGINVFQDIFFLLRVWHLLLDEQPDILLCYTIKPVIFGSIAARFARVKKCYSIVTGLGYVFIGDGVVKKVLRLLVARLYKIAISFNDTVFFLNKDDLATFREHKIVESDLSIKMLCGEGVDTTAYADHRENIRISVLDGSGVDLQKYEEVPIQKISYIFLLIARLLKDKGIQEFVDAARVIKNVYPEMQFWIVGPLDSNPTAFTQEELQQWIDEEVIIYKGETRDVRPYIQQSTVYVLPSYREGMPRTVLEAMAMGRPIITTDAPGCRETVVDGDNGFLVPIKDASALAKAMEQFIIKPDLVDQMGRRSREIAEERFDVHKVNNEILQAMGMI